MIDSIVRDIIRNPEFQRLQYVKGGLEYHGEGCALTHSLLVFHNSFEFWNTPETRYMNYIALLHDCGKPDTGREKPNGDWEYPNHARIGAEVLEKFLPDILLKPEFILPAKWFIANHIKPLFWGYNGFPQKTENNIELAKLAICDLKGSFSREPQDEKIASLYEYIR